MQNLNFGFSLGHQNLAGAAAAQKLRNRVRRITVPTSRRGGMAVRVEQKHEFHAVVSQYSSPNGFPNFQHLQKTPTKVETELFL